MIPSNTTFAQGQGSASADQLNSMVQTCQTAAQLRAFVGLTGMSVLLQGITAPGDGHGGLFQWVATATAPDNNSTVIQPSGAGAAGRWILYQINGSQAVDLAVISMGF